MLKNKPEKHVMYYAVCRKEDNAPIGHVSISRTASHELGYAFEGKYHHQGLVTEACRAVIRQQKEDGIPYIIATHDQCNPKNEKVIFRMYQLDVDGIGHPTYTKYLEQDPVRLIRENIGSEK